MLNSFFVGQKCPKYLSSSDEKSFSRWFVFEFHFKCLSKPFQIQIGSTLYPYFFDHVCVVYRYNKWFSFSQSLSHVHFFFLMKMVTNIKLEITFYRKKNSVCERWTNVSSIHAPRTTPLLVYYFVWKMFAFVISTPKFISNELLFYFYPHIRVSSVNVIGFGLFFVDHTQTIQSIEQRIVQYPH